MPHVPIKTEISPEWLRAHEDGDGIISVGGFFLRIKEFEALERKKKARLAKKVKSNVPDKRTARSRRLKSK